MKLLADGYRLTRSQRLKKWVNALGLAGQQKVASTVTPVFQVNKSCVLVDKQRLSLDMPVVLATRFVPLAMDHPTAGSDLDPESAGPLLCGGITVFDPILQNIKFKPFTMLE